MTFEPLTMKTLTVELQDTDIEVKDLDMLFKTGKIEVNDDYVKLTMALGSHHADDMQKYAYNQNLTHKILSDEDINSLRNIILSAFAEEHVFLEFWKELD